MIINLDEFIEYTAEEFNRIMNSIVEQSRSQSSDMVLTNFAMSFGYVDTEPKLGKLNTSTRTFCSGNIGGEAEVVEHPDFLADTIKMFCAIKDGTKAELEENNQEPNAILKHG